MQKKRLLIFGLGQAAELAFFYFKSDSDYSVEAFSVDKAYLKNDQFCGLPVIAFEEIQNKFPPSEFEMFIALGYSEINAIRKKKYLAAKQKGYTLPSYISSRATIFDANNIGDNCFVLENNTIQPFVTIGNNVTLWSGNHIGHHSKVEDHVFVASHAVISGGVKIGSKSFIGVNATLRDNISIGEGCVIGAGALVNKNIRSNYVVKGNVSQEIISTSDLKKI